MRGPFVHARTESLALGGVCGPFAHVQTGLLVLSGCVQPVCACTKGAIIAAPGHMAQFACASTLMWKLLSIPPGCEPGKVGDLWFRKMKDFHF